MIAPRHSSVALAMVLASVWLFGGMAWGDDTLHEVPIDDYDREHWSFTPLSRPAVPCVDDARWAENEIDYFVLRRLQASGLSPAPPASREVLLRRVSFDLVGLPPTRAEVEEFVGDSSPQAYEQLVDRLLASPAYGERWGQHWLDLARFAETDGFEHDKLRAAAWEYRQWVVDALNGDMPYDRFVTLQLAGDLISPETDAIATGFCMAGPDMPDINEQDLRRHDKLNEITATVGAALLGLQMGCAQCHDHKYDPISQADFYRLRAIFEGAVPQLKRDKHVAQLAVQHDSRPAYLYRRGELSGRGPVVQPAPPRIACSAACGWSDQDIQADPRLAFAEWLFRPGNPLAARVIANRIWLHHFGQSLCGNPSDLGVIDIEPTHPELLDWLATQLQGSEWSLKALHRKILLSATYRQAGMNANLDAADSRMLQLCIDNDPDNRLYGRFPRKRLEGEVIRDSLLAIAGLSNRAYGGPSVMPPLPAELIQTLLRGQWQTSAEESDHYRRSIYVLARRNLRYPLFDVFDRPDAGVSCAVRNVSTTALQSLQLLNSDLAVQAAQALSQRVLRETSTQEPEALIEHLCMIVYSRPPTRQDLRVMADALSEIEGPLEEQLFVIGLAMLNSNEFIYCD